MNDQPSNAGASAFREYERRKAKDVEATEQRRERVRNRFGGGKFGSVVAAFTVDGDERSSTKVWQQGAVGEVAVGNTLDALSSAEFEVLHDRRIPRSRANIDHIVVNSSGVWVIDTKRYLGKRPERYRKSGGYGLKVGGRKRDALVDGVLRQVESVRGSLSDKVPVRGLLCFVDADWPLIGGSFEVQGIRVVWPKRLARELQTSQPVVQNVGGLTKFLENEYRPA